MRSIWVPSNAMTQLNRRVVRYLGDVRSSTTLGFCSKKINYRFPIPFECPFFIGSHMSKFTGEVGKWGMGRGWSLGQKKLKITW